MLSREASSETYGPRVYLLLPPFLIIVRIGFCLRFRIVVRIDCVGRKYPLASHGGPPAGTHVLDRPSKYRGNSRPKKNASTCLDIRATPQGALQIGTEGVSYLLSIYFYLHHYFSASISQNTKNIFILSYYLYQISLSQVAVKGLTTPLSRWLRGLYLLV